MKRPAAIHLLFELGVIGKGVDGILEIVGGALLLAIPPERIHSIVQILTQHELSEDPHDRLAHYLLNSTQDLSTGTTLFAAFYLLWHGAVKMGLVAGLLLKRRLAYPAAIGAFILFVVYQLYRYTHTQSSELLVLSIIDVGVILLTWLEYRRLKAMHGFAGTDKRS